MKKEPRYEIYIASAIVLAMAYAVFADVTVRHRADDGVNEVVQTVGANGYVTSSQTTLAHVPQKYVPPTDDENAKMKQAMIDALEAAKRREAKAVADGVIVSQVFGEGTNSSFITRRELTATQKRFLALGHRYTQLAIAYWQLEARLRKLEAERRDADASKVVTEVK